MNRGWLLGLIAICFSACQPDPYVLVQLASIPDTARSLKLTVVRGAERSSPSPIVLPNTSYIGLTVRLDLPPGTQDEVEVAVGAYDGLDGNGCLLATGIGSAVPSGPLGVQLRRFTAPTGSCSSAEPIILSVTPAIINTALAAQTELSLTGWGFRPDSQISIDGVPVAEMSFVSITTVKVLPGPPARVGMVLLGARQPDGPTVERGDLLRFYSLTVDFANSTYTPKPQLETSTVFPYVLTTTTAIDQEGKSRLAFIAPTGTAINNQQAFMAKFDRDQLNNNIVYPEDAIFLDRTFEATTIFTSDALDFDKVPDFALRDTTTAASIDAVAIRNILGVTRYKCNALSQDPPILSFTFAKFGPVNSSGFRPKSLVIADGMKSAPPSVGLLHSNNLGAFSSSVSLGCQSTTFTALDGSAHSLTDIRQVLAADLDGDQRDELLLLESLGGQLAVAFLPPGDPFSVTPLRFQRVQTRKFGPATVQSMAVTDINSDGKSDLVLVTSDGGTMKLYVSTSLSTSQTVMFSDVVVPLPVYCAGGVSIRFADLNEDLHPDVVVGCQQATAPHRIEVLVSQGKAGDFPLRTDSIVLDTLDLGSNLLSVEAVHAEGDGRLDLVAAGGATVQVLRNTSR